MAHHDMSHFNAGLAMAEYAAFDLFPHAGVSDDDIFGENQFDTNLTDAEEDLMQASFVASYERELSWLDRALIRSGV